MKANQKGFSIVEALVILVIIGLLGAVGWLVYDRQKGKPNSQQTSTQKQTTSKQKAASSTPYTFKELGISMNILSGWEVKASPTKEDGVNFYDWTIEKSGTDGKINLSSTGFRGGFEGCQGADSLTTATIKDVAPTQNANLLFMSWSYDYDNQINDRTGIVSASEAVFKTTNNANATAVANKSVKAGSYFFCISEPLAGFWLRLNDEAAPGFSRKDSIDALASNSSDSKYIALPTSAQSYADIKTMLTSIK